MKIRVVKGNEPTPEFFRYQSTTATPQLGWLSRQYDSESGNHYLVNRYYNSNIGQFTSTDWYKYVNTDNPYSMNLYQYGYGNPNVYTDRDGEWNEIGHFYTVYAVARAAGIPNKQAEEIAFFSQMPDEVYELEATTPLIDSYRNKDEKLLTHTYKMQILFHVLIPKDIKLQRKYTKEYIGNLNENWKIGLMIHRFGDTFGHNPEGVDHWAVNLVNNPEKLLLIPNTWGMYSLFKTLNILGPEEGKGYKRGVGHGPHGLVPDNPYYHKEMYKKYVDELAKIMRKIAKKYPNSDYNLEKFENVINRLKTEVTNVKPIKLKNKITGNFDDIQIEKIKEILKFNMKDRDYFKDNKLLINKIPMEKHDLEKLDDLMFNENFYDYDIENIYDLLDNFKNGKGDIWEFFLKIALSRK